LCLPDEETAKAYGTNCYAPVEQKEHSGMDNLTYYLTRNCQDPAEQTLHISSIICVMFTIKELNFLRSWNQNLLTELEEK
jgi:hypothetical protein